MGYPHVLLNCYHSFMRSILFYAEELYISKLDLVIEQTTEIGEIPSQYNLLWQLITTYLEKERF